MTSVTTMLAQTGFFDWTHKIQFREDAGTELGRFGDWVYMVIFWISTIAFVVLMAMMVWFAYKYRRRPGVAPERSASHNTPLELFWTIVPSITLVWMFFYGFWGYAEAIVQPAHGTELLLQAQQWSWQVTYPNGATSGLLQTKHPDAPGLAPYNQTQRPDADAKRLGRDDIPVIVVPVGEPVKFRMISLDVLHAFWVPDFRGKLDVVPNRYTNYWFQADESQIGDHWVFCAEYCGKDHSEMWAVLRVLPREDYDRIIAKWGTPEDPVQWGKLLWTNRCRTCHTTDGKPNTGPTWQGLFGKTEHFTDGSSQQVDEDYIRQSILFPGNKIVQGFKNQMQSFQGQLSEEQINAIIQFIKSPEVSGQAAPPGSGETPAGPDGGAGGSEPVGAKDREKNPG